MIDKDLILRQIELSGSITDRIKINHLINNNPNNVIDNSSGRNRIRTNKVDSFKLILSSPFEAVNPLEIKCLNCGRVIKYPAWHCELQFDINHFHYFVCFAGTEKVKLICR